eukprot:3585154-Pyramimonas_sp.AAC.1
MASRSAFAQLASSSPSAALSPPSASSALASAACRHLWLSIVEFMAINSARHGHVTGGLIRSSRPILQRTGTFGTFPPELHTVV